MSSRQNDKLKKLLGMKEKRVPDMVRHREMNDVRNYNRNQQARVFENEKRQVARYADTNAPESSKDIGSAFKLQVYTLKLQGLLQAKTEAVQAVELVIGTENQRQVRFGLSELRGRQGVAPYLNTIFGKAEVTSTFNEMMAFIKTYMGDVFSNDRVRDSAYTSFLTPLAQNLVACANEYPSFYATLPVRQGQLRATESDVRSRTIYREQCIQQFSLLMAMAENINIQALRPISAEDVDSYAEKNDVSEIIENRGQAVMPSVPALPAGQPILPQRPDEPPPPAPDAPYPPAGPNQPAVPQQPQQGQQGQAPMASVDSTKQMLLAFEQDGNSLRRSDYQPPNGTGLRRALLAWNDQQQAPFPVPRVVDIESARVEINRERRGGQPAPQPAPAPQQGQQGGPAQDPRTEANFDGFETNNIVLGALGVRTGTQVGDATETIINNVRGVENDQQRVMNAKNDADVQAVYDLLDTRNRPAYEAEYTTEADRKARIREVIRAMRNARIAFVQQRNLPATSERQLWGMGKKANAKVFLRGCGVPEDIIGTSFMRHGLSPDALVEELEGSGIMDTLKNFAGSVADSASGWWDTIKANMPTMSDVRRAVGKIVPDQYSDYVPSGLKRTFGDKAKDFFGFGMSGGEFQADPHRSTATRHREPFDNFFDNRGYRQGAVQRMTTMFVPDWELSSGLNRLKGGDQLADNDIELLRRQDHHDVSLYKPAVIQQPIHGYGADGDEDAQYEGGLKQRLSRAVAPDVISRPYRKDPMFVHRVEDHDEFQPRTIGDEGFAHYEELEKPADMDDDPNPFRVRTENHKVNTGKMKKVTYHTK
jgi:hypothetical protein